MSNIYDENPEPRDTENPYTSGPRRNHTINPTTGRSTLPQPTPRNSPGDEINDSLSKPAVFKVIKNPPSKKEKNLNYNPYNDPREQDEYEDMLGMNKVELFENFNDDRIRGLIKKMGGVQNFVTHFRISNGEFEDLFPEYRDRKDKKFNKENFNLTSQEVNKTPRVLNTGEIDGRRGKIIEMMAPAPRNFAKNGENLNFLYNREMTENYPHKEDEVRRRRIENPGNGNNNNYYYNGDKPNKVERMPYQNNNSNNVVYLKHYTNPTPANPSNPTNNTYQIKNGNNNYDYANPLPFNPQPRTRVVSDIRQTTTPIRREERSKSPLYQRYGETGGGNIVRVPLVKVSTEVSQNRGRYVSAGAGDGSSRGWSYNGSSVGSR